MDKLHKELEAVADKAAEYKQGVWGPGGGWLIPPQCNKMHNTYYLASRLVKEGLKNSGCSNDEIRIAMAAVKSSHKIIQFIFHEALIGEMREALRELDSVLDENNLEKIRGEVIERISRNPNSPNLEYYRMKHGIGETK